MRTDAKQKWRHWNPRQHAHESPTTQRAIEKDLQARWADRLIELLLPHAKDIPFIVK